MGLQGMINDLLQQCDTPISPCPEATSAPDLSGVAKKLSSAQGNLARIITCVVNNNWQLPQGLAGSKEIPVIGITGTVGAGKSSLTDELIRRFLTNFPERRLAVISVDPYTNKNDGSHLAER